MLLGNFSALKAPSGRPGVAKPLGVSEKAVGPSMCVCGPPTGLEERLGSVVTVSQLFMAPNGLFHACSIAFISDGLCIGSCFPGWISFGI